MPSKSKAQHNKMERAAHDAKYAARESIPQKVARDFVAADKKAGKFQGKSNTHKK